MKSLGLVLGLAFLALAHPSLASVAESRHSAGGHDVRLGDVTLHYVVVGRGAPVLVPSPNWGPGSLYLQRGLQPLEADHMLIFIDSRGSGASSKPEDAARMSIDDMADDIERLRVYLGFDRFALIGHSAAGSASIEYAERYHGHLDRLVLVDSAVAGHGADAKAEDSQTQTDFRRLAADPRYASAVQHIMHDPLPPTSDEAMMRWLTDTGAIDFADPGAAGPRFAATIQGMTPSSYAWRASDAADKARPVEQAAHLDRIDARVLIVHGRQDWLVPFLTAEHLHQRFPRADFAPIDGSGHFPWIEQPEIFFSAVNNFLH